ncbi:response regulator [Metasolibacillus sp. FSL H7-0170]|uniref:hypothetical protein n=1 Tax=Metasolibacillus TaxID=2703677 RepID=UPI000798E322|nr:hypothetical protein [Metasolibacillus fluoroglycofenilyticus]KYG92232.1 hypothetical protein A0U40_04635 [[Bacillus] sp. KCTC 13219]
MRKILYHIIVFLGAISNAFMMARLNVGPAILIGTTVAYVVVLEGLFLFLEPRLAVAARKRNLTTYPFLKNLIDAKKATVTLKTGEVIYNASFNGYSNPKDANTIKLDITQPKTKKQPEKIETRDVLLTHIKEVKKVL